MKKLIGLAALVALGLAACGAPPEVVSGANTINAADLANHIETLSSDEFEGRAPSSPGEEKTVAYIAEYFNAYGLRPGNGESYFQEVPLVDITASADQQLVITGPDVSINLRYADDYVAGTRRVVDRIDVVMSEMIFVGYGIVAPEYGWNDYQGIDMTGKTAVILVNDPGYATHDQSLFTGYAMTYYGRWTYKYEEAMRQGADAAIVIHETGPAGYPWAVVRGGWTGQQFYLESADGNMSRSKVEGWITGEAAEAIFAAAGLDLAELTEAASNKGFKPVAMDLMASLSFPNEINHSRSRNVVGIVPGSEKPDEYFLYMAHWDHFGIGEEIDGDNIYNGAFDNASGIAALLELAEAFGSLETAPKRTMVFLATTAEEQGLLGSEHYGENPLFPLNKTIAGLNIDGLNLIGRTRDIVVTGFGLSEMDAYLERAAAAQGRVLAPDPDVEKGYYYRSDHFNLAKKGVPMIYPGGGIDHVEFGSDYGQAQADDYVANRYHKPSDEYDPDWDLSGGVEDVKLYYAVGEAVANGDLWPNWNIGTEFRAIRDQSLREAAKVEKISIKLAVKFDASAADVWAMIGDFGDINWHPAISSTVAEGAGLDAVRTVTLVDNGGELFETLDAMGDMSYSYTVISSPFPMKNYSATIEVIENGDGATVEWSSTFEADGISSEELEKIVSNFYEAGFEAIQAELNQ
ncbi:MAG: M28 family peptidase [Proteobacteria bacterium]|nr:M28 family peptidase [Pseudomonadota bacterium]